MKIPVLSIPTICFVLLSLLASPFSGARDYKPDPKWEESMDAFTARDVKSPPADGSLLFVGSSSIRMWDLAKSWPDTATINNGFGGSTIADSIAYFETVFPKFEPSAIILYAGDNDINKGLTPAEVVADFKTLAEKLTASYPETPVLYVAIKPSSARWNLWPKMKEANDSIAAFCNETDFFFFADTAAPMLEGREGAPADDWFIEDGLHLSAGGYEKWTVVVKSVLEEAAKPESK